MTSTQRFASANHERHERQILDLLGEERSVTQRSLAADLGIALGLTNLLMRRLVLKGWVRVKHVSPRRIRYLLTPAGVAAKAQLTRQYFLSRVGFYRDCRRHVRDRLLALSQELQARGTSAPTAVVFFGAGDVAEVAYVCLQNTGLALVGVVDDQLAGRFFNVPISTPDALTRETIGGMPYSHVIVTNPDAADAILQRLAARDIPAEKVFCL